MENQSFRRHDKFRRDGNFLDVSEWPVIVGAHAALCLMVHKRTVSHISLCSFNANLGKFLFCCQAFSSIHRNGFVDDGAAVDALPGIED